MSSRKSAADAEISNFCGVTGANPKVAKQYLDKHKRLDRAVDEYFMNGGTPLAASSNKAGPSTTKLNAIFDKYKDQDIQEDLIGIDGTMQFCEDIGLALDDVVLLAIATDLKSKKMGSWERQPWIDGWKVLGCVTVSVASPRLITRHRCDSLEGIRSVLPRIRAKLHSDPAYFKKVYNHTFDFGRNEGQRSLAMDSALPFWGLLIPAGLSGQALAHYVATEDGDEALPPPGETGWTPQLTDLWTEYMETKGGKGVSKDTWQMFLDFVRSMDSRLERFNALDTWPSTIDDFVEWAKERL
ncbi:defective in Cullin neddylation protein 1 [Cylindrobasidium torrendii FP15055 ss-10]|uniref:Defective in cullin neddylation protein n=1 Tax=Cylindrobasidium torrendii FP15055 ss-10 TaxID=1314674 RepID=A0A0D7BE57_9AGAR|nr:defective in Cullin neddylation protein 1 [Cylindrobasidium torrendii FP15055 ss-10]